MKVRTGSGFECEIPSGITQDFRFIKARQALKSDDPDVSNQAMLDMVSIVFCNEEEENRFLLHLADKDGRIPVSDVFGEIGEILAQAGEKNKKIKNS